jgi:predicted permease
MMRLIFGNLRYAARQLRHSPAFTGTVILTLALCIGVNTAIFTIVDALFFRALPYPHPERLAMLSTAYGKGGASALQTSQDGHEWELTRDHATLIEPAVYGSTGGVNLFAAGRAQYVRQQRVSADFFGVLGIAPLIGREFTRQEDVAGGPALTILSYALWQRVFHGDPSIVGRTVDLRGAPYTVVGIMPRGFRTIDAQADLWTPLRPSAQGEGGGTNYSIIARLKPGVTLVAASDQLTAIMRPYFKTRYSQRAGLVEERAVPMQAGLANDLRSSLHLIWGAVILVLLIGCVNIAGILLARSATRSREIATRIALGASRGRVVAQLLAEAVLLAFGGGLLGLLFGELALTGLLRLNPDEFASWGAIHLDSRVMAIMLAVSLATSMIFGLLPAVEATSVDIRSALAEAGRTATRGRHWKREALVFAEVALGVVLVVAAGLLIRSFARLAGMNPGFDPNHVMTASLSLQDARYSTSQAGARLFRESLERIREIPGVESAAVALTAPYQRALNDNIERISGSPITQGSSITNLSYVTPGFFETLKVPLLRGRVFTESDNANGAKAAIVNEDFINRYLRNVRDRLGTSIQIEGVAYQIVGIVANVPYGQGWGANFGPIAPLAHVYVPAAQFPDALFAMANVWVSPSWIVRTRGNVGGLPGAMQHAIERVDPRLPFSAFHNISELRGEALHQQRYQAVLFSAFAGLALLLAALGVYGLVSESVAQRTREMGIRMALGATARNLVRTAATSAIMLSLGGIGAGFVLALGTARLLQNLIWGIRATDPVTFAFVAVLLIVVAALSSILPALRLARLDPAQTLRHE